MVYISEAHAIDGTFPIPKGPIVEEPLTLDERKKVAATCAGALDLSPIKMVIDGIDDKVGLTYAAWPDRLYLVGADGKLAYCGDRGPRGFLPDELEKAIRAELKLDDKK
jgi:Iodothyronine deiodinase